MEQDFAEIVRKMVANGYVVLENVFDDRTCESLRRRLDLLSARRPPSKALVPDSFFNKFVTRAELLRYARELLGPELLFHHANGRAMVAGGTELAWHHDYDAPDPSIRSGLQMIHFMIYPGGLTADSGPLMIFPGSHLMGVARSFPQQFGCKAIEGSIEVVGRPGLVVIIDSAMWHARKQPILFPRYDLNVSFCKPGIHRPERGGCAPALAELYAGAADEHKALFRTL
jgi:ectoine hydroxylase-related dioxygenase (phytanoyl-CoA dioxygenase family)